VSFKVIVTMSAKRSFFHNRTPDLQDQDQDHNVQTRPIRPQRARPRPISDRSCPKTDGLRPHHWLKPNWLCELVWMSAVESQSNRCYNQCIIGYLKVTS